MADLCLDKVVLLLKVNVAQVEVAVGVEWVYLKGSLVCSDCFVRLMEGSKRDSNKEVGLCLQRLRCCLVEIVRVTGTVKGLIVKKERLLRE